MPVIIGCPKELSVSPQPPKSSVEVAYEDGFEDAVADGINNNLYVEGTAEFAAYDDGFRKGLASKLNDDGV